MLIGTVCWRAQTLQCEPWFHNSEPPYETMHFLSNHACFPCRVAHCATCNRDEATCDTCAAGRYLLQTAAADTCEEVCPLGYDPSVDTAGMDVCLPTASSSKLDSKTIAGISVAIVLLVAIGLVAFMRYRRKMKRKRVVDKFRVKTADAGKAIAEAEKNKMQAELDAFKEEVGQNLREVVATCCLCWSMLAFRGMVSLYPRSNMSVMFYELQLEYPFAGCVRSCQAPSLGRLAHKSPELLDKNSMSRTSAHERGFGLLLSVNVYRTATHKDQRH